MTRARLSADSKKYAGIIIGFLLRYLLPLAILEYKLLSIIIPSDFSDQIALQTKAQ